MHTKTIPARKRRWLAKASSSFSELLRTMEGFRHRRDRFTVLDYFYEAVRGISVRPGRLFLTVTAMTLGISALVATIGFSQTGANQISAKFDAIAATRVTVQIADKDGNESAVIPFDSDRRAERLNGVVRAGLIAEVSEGIHDIKATQLFDPLLVKPVSPKVIAATSGLLEVTVGTVTQGLFINRFHEDTAQRVVVLGARAANSLGVQRISNIPAIFINDISYTVIGIVSGMKRHPELEDAVILPLSTARKTLGLKNAGQLEIAITVGAGSLVSKQIPYVLDPVNHAGYLISAPTLSSNFRETIAAEIDSLFLVIGLLATIIGALTIAVVTSMSVMERSGEIGLRRALGAKRRQIAGLLIAESGIIGLLGGLIGAGGGMLVVVGISFANEWTPVLDMSLVVMSALGGVVIAILAGLIPAIRAARLEPAKALQEGT